MQFLLFLLFFCVSLVLTAAFVKDSISLTDWIADYAANRCGISAAPAVRAHWFHQQAGRVLFWVAAPASLLGVGLCFVLRMACH